jgi:hypothetical protein
MLRERSSMNEPGVIGVELNRSNRELSMLKRKPLFTLFLIVALQEMLSQNAFAYLDPGTGSYIFQVLIAVFIGGLFTIKSYWQKIKDFFINRFSKRQEK